MPTQIHRIRLGAAPGGRPSLLAIVLAVLVATVAFVLGLGLLVFMFVAGMVGMVVMWVRRRFGLGSPASAPRPDSGPGSPPPADPTPPEAEPVDAEDLESFRGNLDEWFEGRRGRR